MAITHERRGMLYVLGFLAILALAAGTMVDGVDAKGRSKVKTSLSIRDRVNIQTDNCEFAGGEISVSYAYEDDGSESATTSCSGGILDGNTCINEASTMECWQKSRPAPPLKGLAGTRPTVPITEVQVVDPTPTVALPGALDEQVAPVDMSGDAGTVAQPGDGSVLGNPVIEPVPVEPTSRDGLPMPVLVPLD